MINCKQSTKQPFYQVKISDGIFLFKMKCLKKYGQKVKFDLIGLENDKSFRRPPCF
ncbi:hypothetical protein HMPREF3156_00289 [Neisseria sp. HMSC06F02]|nr:hypothetical protein HMPREF3156_00289 [Neisseria sp. HMSC06F02]